MKPITSTAADLPAGMRPRQAPDVEEHIRRRGAASRTVSSPPPGHVPRRKRKRSLMDQVRAASA